MRYHVGRRRLGSRHRASVALLVACASACPLIGVASSAWAESLPDGRGYELVSPADAGGASAWSLLDPTSQGRLQAWGAVARDGSAVIWRATTALPGVPESSGLFDTYRSVRGSGSWESGYAAMPRLTGGVIPPDLQFASPNVDRLLWDTFNATTDPSDHDPAGSVPMSDPHRYQDLYVTGADGSIVHVNRGSIEVPVASEGPGFIGASEDLRKVMFTSDRQLEPEAPAGGATSTYWTDGQTTKWISKDETGAPLTGDFHSIGLSGDGSLATILSEDRKTLYAWSAQSDVTVKAVGPVFPSAAQGDVVVDSISADGKRIFFSTAESLSGDDTDTSRDLYKYDTSNHQTTLVSVPSGGGPLGNSDGCAASLPSHAQCDVSPVIESRDGSVVYFVSPERLVSGQGVDGGVNLYRAAGGEIRFVATLDPSDPVFEGNGVTTVRTRHVRLTPDSSKLLFESRAKLTGYDNAGFMEVYLYDPGSGSVVCASCRPSGAPPTADSTLFQYSGPSSPKIGGDPQISSANADEHGDRVFFNSNDAIVPEDVNGRNDVYEFSVASRSPALISSGTSENDSAYMGNGVDGRDVFFITSDSLVPQDHNGNIYKIYDARVGGGFPVPAVPSVCVGAGCRVDEAAPVPGAQGSGRVVARRSPQQSAVAVSRLVVSGSRAAKGRSLRLTAKVSSAGRLRVSGGGLRAVSRKAGRAGSYHLTVGLSKASVARLRRVGRVVVSATVRFVPTRGSARSVRVRLTFSAPSTRNAR